MHQYSIDQYASLTRWHDLVERINDAQPEKSYVRKLVDGREITIVKKPKAINSNEKATGERIIKDYISYYLRLIKKMGNQALENGPPGFYTNSVEIGARRGCSDRTARSHVRKLQKHGLISGYKFHGSKHDFELWISQDILWDSRIREAYKPENRPAETASLGQILKNFPHTVTVTHSNTETETNKCPDVEHGDERKAVGFVEHGDTKQGNTEQQPPKTAHNVPPDAPEAHQGYHEQGGGGPAAQTAGNRLKKSLSGQKRAVVRLERTEEQKRVILEGYLSSFWLYAKQILYPGRTFRDFEDESAIRAIRAGVYRNFEYELSEKDWDKLQEYFYRRIDLAAAYYSRHADRWIPDPFARHREGTGYFDWENLRGFRATGAWLEDNLQKYRRNYVQGRISWAILQLRKHRDGKATKRLQAKTYIDAYRTLEETMANYGEAAVDRFRNLASTIGQQKPQIVKGFNRNFKQ
ncbi:hypothetical protein ACS5NO_17410 [Larkinella sp. GY13]|uniref:hypothetical protein n=1 Tax=Larkinella sp. GY13 TaxID=3453720 RepID=UPI003EF08240